MLLRSAHEPVRERALVASKRSVVISAALIAGPGRGVTAGGHAAVA